MMAEPVVSLGDVIPMVPYARPKTPESTLNMALALAQSDAFLLQNHGVVTVGPDLETAFLRMELVEHLAKIPAGGPTARWCQLYPVWGYRAFDGRSSESGLGPSGTKINR